MRHLINISHPHKLEKINTTSKLLLTYKNILIQMYNKGYIEKTSGTLIVLRWSILQKKFVIDLLNKKGKILFIEKDIKEHYYNDLEIASLICNLIENANKENFLNFSDQFNLRKNENRLLLFQLSSNTIYFIGLYQKKEEKKYVPIDISNIFLNKFSNNFSFIKKNKFGKITEPYHTFYSKMIKSVKENTLDIIIDNVKTNISMEEFMSSNKKFNNVVRIKNKNLIDTSINLYKNIIKENLNLNLNEFNLIKNGFLSTHFNLLAGNYIKNKLNTSSDGIIINTGVFQFNNVKIVGDSILNKHYTKNTIEQKNNNYKPIIPFKF